MASIIHHEPQKLRRAAEAVCEQVTASQSKTYHWSELDERELWFELASCILGSQVPYELATAASNHIRSEGLLRLPSPLDDMHEYERKLVDALRMTAFPSPTNLNGQHYRFPHIRANYLRRTAERIYVAATSLHRVLAECRTGREARRQIVSLASGVGPKQASLFLRNVGFANDDLAVLDVHVLRYMDKMDLAPAAAKIVHTLEGYECIELAFCKHAKDLGFPPSCFDLAVWIVMRVL